MCYSKKKKTLALKGFKRDIYHSAGAFKSSLRQLASDSRRPNHIDLAVVVDLLKVVDAEKRGSDDVVLLKDCIAKLS